MLNSIFRAQAPKSFPFRAGRRKAGLRGRYQELTVSSALGSSLLGLGALIGCMSCSSHEPLAEGPRAAKSGLETKAPSKHRGPGVADGNTGPARFVESLYRDFNMKASMETVKFIDGFYRAPGNDGYEAVVDYLIEHLKAAGFQSDDDSGSGPRLTLRVIEDPMTVPTWTPLRGELAMLVPDAEREILHKFDFARDRDRVMLPINAPACDVTGKVVLDIADLNEGDVLVINSRITPRTRSKAIDRGAAGIISSYLSFFNVDGTGRERHLDAIWFSQAPAGGELPIAHISPRSFERIAAEVRAGKDVGVHLECEVKLEQRPLRTVIAEVVGSEMPDEAVVISSHIQEPGTCDNATGVAGLLENVLSLTRLFESGKVEWPRRTLAFVWGDEFKQTRSWFAHTDRKAIAGISADMTGQSQPETGAIQLLERMPDPGALATISPDVHTDWGAGDVEASALRPNGFSLIGRCALYDVGKLVGGWVSADHPWEGGSDHDIFIDKEIPGVLFWHFTDFAYHTSLDRLDMVDPNELRRSHVAIVATAMAVANPHPEDLERYLASLKMEEDLRVDAALKADRLQIAELWKTWCAGSREWIEDLCR